MESQNFDFLRNRYAPLATLGAFAESYVRSDPDSACVKLRIMMEEIVRSIYDEQRLALPEEDTFHNRLIDGVFTRIVPTSVRNKLHAIRQSGNKAAHGRDVTVDDALHLLRESHSVAVWFYLTYTGGSVKDFKPFEVPGPGAAAASTALSAQMAQQEQKLEEVLQALEEERAKRIQVERRAEEELNALRERAEKQARELDFSEANTRKFLIDGMLIDAGWVVGQNGKNTPEVGQEIELAGMPTDSGKGLADYVLWGSNGKPLAVIEAKKTAVSVEKGRTQARLYANALEAMHGQRPVIFYTNGIDIHLWDDAQKNPPRKVYGFFSKDSLEYLHFQRTARKPLHTVAPDLTIADRKYQLEAVKRVTERFAAGYRKALIVQATGTGKTRVAVSICDVLAEANWVKRILFLCDRKELRKQAANAFKEFMPGQPLVYVTKDTAKDRDQRIYVATYPAMMRYFESFDVGFFDLIIADESHRSIYNKYQDLFKYFDAFQIGLTATPVHLVDRNTYKVFGCEDQDPTFSYGLDEAINHVPPYLVPYRVIKVTTKFQREGIKFSQMTPEEQREFALRVENAESVEHEARDLDRLIFNRDTSRAIIRNLMEHGITDTSGSLPGKSIIFARNHRHAEHLYDVFNELYPAYGGRFCQVIDNYDPKAEQLIDDFKDHNSEIRIAISVDMLDTGIDIPEIVNLVFAKPIGSPVKFWQMIGRGTRLCKNLFGPGKDKKEFLIFDHWGNFDVWEDQEEEAPDAPQVSLMESVFQARVELAQTALKKLDQPLFEKVVPLIEADINRLKDARAIDVRDHWRALQVLGSRDVLEAFDAATHKALLETVAPLMRWVDIRGHEEAHRFDLLVARLQTALVREDAGVADLRGDLLNELEQLRMNLNQVKAKAETIKRVRSAAFWEGVTAIALEDVRQDLRGIMKYRLTVGAPRSDPKEVDAKDRDIERVEHIPTYRGQELLAYRTRVEGLLRHQFEHHPVLARIRAGAAVSPEDLRTLAREVHQVDPQINLMHLATQIGLRRSDPTGVEEDLHRALRSIVGLDAEAVDEAFTRFTHKHPELTSEQRRFLSMLQAHITTNGGLEVARLYEAPFTRISPDGIEGVFDALLVDELLRLVRLFNQSDIKGASA